MELLPIGTDFEGYLRDESRLSGTADFIVFPENTEPIREALCLAKSRGLSVKVQGARTGLVGGAVPRGGLVLNLSRMNRILGMEDGGLRAQAGVSLEQIETYAAAQGCFFPPNPTEATATIGGVFATGAAGASSLRYGAASRSIQALCWLTSEGALWELQRGDFVFDEHGCDLPEGKRLRVQPSNAAAPLAFGTPYSGLDLIDFLAGSEGKLGLAAELVLTLLPLPSQSWAVIYFFSEMENAFAFGEALGSRLERDRQALVCAEFLNGGALSRLKPEKLGLPPFPKGAEAAVYAELAGEGGSVLEAILAEHLELFAKIGENEENTWAEEGISGLRRFRQLRHAVPALVGEQPGFREEDGRHSARMETDFSGSPQRTADYIRMYQSGLKTEGLSGVIYGHLLQNRLHTAIFCNSPQEAKRANALITRWAERVVADGGTLVTENGVGSLKAALLDALMPKDVQAQRRAIKDFFDPEGRLY